MELTYAHIEQRGDISLREACGCLEVSSRGYRLLQQRKNIFIRVFRLRPPLRDRRHGKQDMPGKAVHQFKIFSIKIETFLYIKFL